ncbi:MAG: hypothetical protein AAFU85_13460 [Planctomycetota bacterium]
MIYMIRYQYRNDVRKTLPDPIPAESIGVYGLSLAAPFECVFIQPDGTREPSDIIPPLLAERVAREIARNDFAEHQRRRAEFMQKLREEFEAEEHEHDWDMFYRLHKDRKPAPIYSPKPERSFVRSASGEKLDPLTRTPFTYMNIPKGMYAYRQLVPRFRTPDGHLVPLSTDRNGGYRAWTRVKAKRRTGATIDPKWETFGGFFEDMGAPPIELATDSGAMVVSDCNHYGPGSARWAPSRRGKTNVELWVCPFTGEKLPLAELCKRHGHPACRVRNRVRERGWSLERALLDDPRPHARGKQKRETAARFALAVRNRIREIVGSKLFDTVVEEWDDDRLARFLGELGTFGNLLDHVDMLQHMFEQEANRLDPEEIVFDRAGGELSLWKSPVEQPKA